MSASVRTLRAYWIVAAGIIVAAVRSMHSEDAKGTLLIDPYWVWFYLSNYHDGFRRRALVGSVCRHLFPGGVNIVLINIIAVLVLVAALFLLGRALCRLFVVQGSYRSRLFLFALSASALTAVFCETLGDLLQLTLVLACAAAILARRWLPHRSIRLVLLLAVAALCFLIHEASIFLVIPALPFLLKSWPRPRDFVLPACLLLVLVALSLHWSNVYPQPTYHANLTGHRILQATTAAAPALHWELETEHRLYFSSNDALLYFAGRWPRILALGLAYLIALAICVPRRMVQRCLYALACIVLTSLPLWCIAVDWGRFLSYAFFLAVVSSALWQSELTDDSPPAPSAIAKLTGRLETLSQMELIQLGAVFVLLAGPEAFAAHIEGTSLQDALCFWILCGAALLVKSRTEADFASDRRSEG